MQRYPFSNHLRLNDDYIFLGDGEATIQAIICAVWNYNIDDKVDIFIGKDESGKKFDLSTIQLLLDEPRVVNADLDIYKGTLSGPSFMNFLASLPDRQRKRTQFEEGT